MIEQVTAEAIDTVIADDSMSDPYSCNFVMAILSTSNQMRTRILGDLIILGARIFDLSAPIFVSHLLVTNIIAE